MNKTMLSLLAFAAGGLLGALGMHMAMNAQCEARVQEEIASVREMYKHRADVAPAEGKNEAARKAYIKRAKEARQKQEPKQPAAQANAAEIRVITEDEFGDSDNECISLTYYEDGTLADDGDIRMDDAEIERTVGRGSLARLRGVVDSDCIYVRNDRLKADFEIIRDARTYAEILQEKPWLAVKNGK